MRRLLLVLIPCLFLAAAPTFAQIDLFIFAPASQTTDEDTDLFWNNANSNRVIVIYSGDSENILTVELFSSSHGEFALSTTQNLNFIVGDGQDIYMQFQGKPLDVNNALEDMRFIPLPNSTVPDELNLMVSEGALTASAIVTIHINPINDPPNIFLSTDATINEDMPIFFTYFIGATTYALHIEDDANPSDLLQVSIFCVSGTFTLATTAGLNLVYGDGIEDNYLVFQGTLNDINAALAGAYYLPPPNDNASTGVNVGVNDLGSGGAGGALTDISSINITINPMPDAPITGNDFGLVQFNTPLPIPVLTNDSDPDGDLLTITQVSDPPFGTAVIQGGSVIYTPDANYIGNDSFTYTVDDGTGELSSIGTVNVVVAGPADLIVNGGFNANWQQVWSVYGSATSNVTGGVFHFFYNQALGSLRPAVLQNIAYALPANTSLRAEFDLGNNSPVRRRVLVIVHNNDFSDFRVCDFWLPPNTPLRRYTMRLFNYTAWNGINIAFYDTIKSASGFLRLDNVTLGYNAATLTTRVTCTDPSAPPAGAGADSANLLTNPNFSGGLLPWGIYGSINYRFVGNVFEYYYDSTQGTIVASLLQPTGVAVPANTTIEARVQLGNSSGVRKRFLILLHDADFSDVRVCDFWLPPNSPLATYVIQTYTTKAWASATISINQTNRSTLGWGRVDNVLLRLRPAQYTGGTVCYEPTDVPLGGDEAGIPAGYVIEAPTLVPTATANAPQVIAEPTLQPSATPVTDAGGEGAGEGSG